MSLAAYDPHVLKTAVILPDRPEVGADAFQVNAPLPGVVWVRVTIVDVGTVRCAIDASAITTLLGRKVPTWGDLETVWQTIAGTIERKIRDADFDAGRGARDRLPIVTITSADVRHHAQQPLGWLADAHEPVAPERERAL
jgi:hypothetical protein